MGWWDSERGGSDDSDGESDFERQRDELIEQLRGRERVSDRALAALAAVPRHEFVPENKRRYAYADRPLPIGEGQTISAPHMVAIMVDRLELEAGQTVLEIGTGCGYHAAVTAEIVGAANVYSVEYHSSLAERARSRLAELGYGDISITVGDGHEGWPEHAPYDRAYLTAAASSVPDALLEQLRPDGIFLGPIGDRRQTLVRVRKRPDGETERETFGGVRFVRMQGGR
ncbi:Protein-L-isoaspartate O-methyltransferase 2 [Halorhabdus tiamatea SARL4B]|uniref:Protein-L-isoaspartate O-methyltransferase n=1 Tax=Halorhabdus tiamatea SARL4B TaxID=1033806 RepID=F7PF16_9EURY|nr:protein-L-isoaspartate(D-aspartate) O-methyltransferase [Halorhabdus tiamatea]ERJ06004.1 Protein-L-isoaspartate O-methyltransferase 2 [Halorhabdus tiamatea SARL4B]CCQ34434.1 protein-L-isoaspartate O-methyltransferase [Halorhabdus tiamatea SARL4B]